MGQDLPEACFPNRLSQEEKMNGSRSSATSRRLRGRSRVALLIFLAVAAFFLLTEHRAHLFGILPYLLLLACPLMHLFMHRGHGNHHGSQRETRRRPGEPSP
jgi:uncharacterized membrane protein YhaH (DUF805 family)